MGASFDSPKEFKEVIDRVFSMMDEDPDMGPKLRDADVPMRSEVANKYFQGKENVAMAIARRRIKSGGDVKAALALMPVTKPVFAQYRAMLEEEYPHLVV